MSTSPKQAWQQVPLGSVADFRNGLNYSKNNFGSGLKVINVKDFQDLIIPYFDELDEINPEGIVREDDLLRKGDIVFVRSNGNRDLIGRSLFITSYQEDVSHSAFTIRVRFTSEEVLPRFYAYLFRSPLIRHVLTAQGGGTNISNLNQGILRDLQIPLPALPTQRKIASVLSAYDDLIENNTRRIQILEEMAQTIYREWFVNFRFPGHEKVEIVDSELGPIPEGWEVKPVAHFGQVVTGKTPSKKVPDYYGEYMPFIKTPDMHGNMFCTHTGEYLSEAGAESQKTKTLPANSICVSCIGTVGIVSITGQLSQTNQQINSLVLRDQSEREFLYFSLLGLKDTIMSYGATGATMANLSKGKFEGLRVICPTKELTSLFHKAVSPHFEQIKVLQAKQANLRRTRDLLLPNLISGEVDVEELDLDLETSEVGLF